MKISLAVKYAKLPADVKTPEALTRFLINEAIAKRFGQGMSRTESLSYAKILEQFYLETDSIEISDEAFLLIKESLDQAMLPPHCSSWKWSLLNHLEECAKNGSRS